MDPLSVAAFATSVAKGTFNCVQSLYKFHEDAIVVDVTLRSLYNETNALQRTIQSIATTLEGLTTPGHDTLHLWSVVNSCLQECWSTVQSLQQQLPHSQGRSNFAEQALKQMKLNFRQDDIKRLRDQMHTHCMDLNMTLLTINLHISSTGTHVVVHDLSPKLDAVLRLLKDRNEDTLPNSTGNKALDLQRHRLRESARQVASRASVVIRSCSTASAGSEPDISIFADNKGPIADPLKSETTGSELGEPLQFEDIRRISKWMKLSNVSSLQAVAEEASKASKDCSNESRTTEESFSSGGATLLASDDIVSDDEDMEAEMAQKMLSLGRQKLKDEKYVQAEAMLRNALGKAQRLGTQARLGNSKDIELEIAIACFEQQKFVAAQELCENIVKVLPAEDTERLRMLEASHLLSQIYLCQAAFDSAVTQCKQTVRGHRRLGGKGKAYNDSVALLVTIHEAKGDDELEGMAYASMLPEDYKRPSFKGPTVQAAKTGHLSAATSKEGIDKDGNLVRPAQPLTAEALLSMETLSLQHQHPTSTHQRRKPNDGVPVEPLKPPQPLQPPSPPQFPPSHDASIHRSNEKIIPKVSPQPVHKAVTPRPPHDTSKALPLRPARPPIYEQRSSESSPSHVDTSPAVSRPTEPSVARSISEPTVSVTRQSSLSPIPGLAPLQRPLTAAQQNEAMRVLDTNGYDTGSKWFDGPATLLWAASHGHDLVVQLILEGWCQEIKKKKFGITTRETVYRDPVYVDITDEFKNTPLHHAACKGYALTCQVLLEHGASTRLRGGCIDNTCPNPDCIDASSDDPNPYCNAGLTALETAIRQVQYDVMKALLAKGADTSRPNSTLLHLTAQLGDRQAFLLLLSAGLNPMIKDTEGKTPLHEAVFYEEMSIVQLLLEHDVEVDARDHEGETPLHVAVRECTQQLTEMLVERGASVHARDNDNWTPLHLAAVNGNEQALQFLVDRGVNLEARNNRGETALHVCADQNHDAFGRKLLAANADPYARDNWGSSVLNTASRSNSTQFVAMLLDLGMEINEQDDDGLTPLMIAASNGHEDVVDLLVHRGADIHVRDSHDRNAMWFAIDNEETNAARILKSAGAEYCPCAKCDRVLAGRDEPQHYTQPCASRLRRRRSSSSGSIS